MEPNPLYVKALDAYIREVQNLGEIVKAMAYPLVIVSNDADARFGQPGEIIRVEKT